MYGLADAIDRRLEEIDSTRIYKIIPVEVRGVKFECGECDEGVEKILHFKGTGQEIMFRDVLFEYGEYWETWFDDILRTGKKSGKLVWLCDWIIKRNYKIIFQKGDITVRKTIS